MHLLRLGILALLCGPAVACVASASPRLDGARIVNSGSTNTLGWSVYIWSNGRGTVGTLSTERMANPARTFSVAPQLVRQLLRDAAAARGERAAGGHCMKSASFGTRLNLFWHGWESPDLSCPAASPALAGLARDAQQVLAVAQPEGGFRRIRMPIEPHRVPPTPGGREGERLSAPKSP